MHVMLFYVYRYISRSNDKTKLPDSYSKIIRHEGIKGAYFRHRF